MKLGTETKETYNICRRYYRPRTVKKKILLAGRCRVHLALDIAIATMQMLECSP